MRGQVYAHARAGLGKAPGAAGRHDRAVLRVANHSIPGLVRQTELTDVSAVTVKTRVRDSDSELLEITFGHAAGWFGDFLLAWSDHGICWLDPRPGAAALAALESNWSPCSLRRDDASARELGASVLSGDEPAPKLHVSGTDFQLRVWSALLGIRKGSYMTYGDLARAIGSPTSARAVGRAVGSNNVAILLPCHRVSPASARSGHYRWGSQLKAALLRKEVGPYL